MSMRYARTRLVAILAIAAALVAAAALPAVADGTFEDDDSSVHEADIEWIAAGGITYGCNPPANDRYCPDDTVTRGEMASFLVRALGLSSAGDQPFVDVAESVHAADIAALAAADVTRGCNPPARDRYCPDDMVTRGQMAAFLVRAFDLPAAGSGPFSDTSGNVFAADIAALAEAGVTQGCNPPSNDRYCPDTPVTRGQMASFIRRALDPSGTSPPPEPPAPPTQGAGVDATCVQVVGFSQTNQWFDSPDGAFERLAGNGQWQALIQGGGAIDRWIEPTFDGWGNVLESECARGSGAPDVVLFTVTGGNRDVSEWVASIEALLATIELRVPTADTVILQPIVGGPGEAECPSGGESVRASENHPDIDAAIAQVADQRDDVVAGASPVVDRCNDYADEIGHLTDEGSNQVGAELGAFYADFVK